MSRIICISDTHKQKGWTLPQGDILIHAGDLTSRGTHEEMFHEIRWLGQFPHPHKVLICGNHDWLGEKASHIVQLLCQDNNITYLEDSSTTILGLKIYGSPYTPEFFNWAFNLPRGPRLKEKWAAIPDDTDILVTHGPPYNILDELEFKAGNVGCADLAERLLAMPNLKAHVFGHIHNAYGIKKIGNTTFINASICNESYRPTNPPIVIEL